ncbi:MAG TPA: hypothetical protein VG275_04885 [Solirubrobacteraceae bacterium]|nr:hypothetical protein [Solirubrobacteraceae bacterium]
MNRLAQEAVLVGLARRLHDRGSWGGETHLQKATYLLHELGGVPFDFNFILYKHGPFSFELRDELGTMRADRLVEREVQVPPYGPRFVVTDRGRELEARFGRTMDRYSDVLDWVAERVGERGVTELERLATALWVTRELGERASVEERTGRLHQVKPHVSLADASDAVREIDEMLAEASVASE